MFNISKGRNYKTEIFYEEDEAFLKLEFDVDFDNSGTKEVRHVTYYKIALDSPVINSKSKDNSSEIERTIDFKLLPNSLNILADFSVKE